jgi:hypothetical protein
LPQGLPKKIELDVLLPDLALQPGNALFGPRQFVRWRCRRRRCRLRDTDLLRLAWSTAAS